MSSADRAGVPAGYHTVTPWVIAKGAAQAIEFMKDAFRAEELGRVEDESGAIGHAEVRIGDSVVMLFDAKPDWPETPAFLRLYVDDADAVFRQALAAGASAVTEVTLLPWGDRVGRVRDPLGNLWWIQARVEDVSEEEFLRRSAEPQYQAAMEYVQSSEFFPRTDVPATGRATGSATSYTTGSVRLRRGRLGVPLGLVAACIRGRDCRREVA